MAFRFRLGPFTFGRSGTRLSPWSRGGGFSIPLFGKGDFFRKLRFGPVSWNFRKSSRTESHKEQGGGTAPSEGVERQEWPAVDAFLADRQLLTRIMKTGVPWRAVQERLKAELPQNLPDLDETAYRLVPKAMQAAFGKQGTAWRTEGRPSKTKGGKTTWVIAN